ncbi:VRR-NUC domain-containing protein [Paracoccus jeotgali]|uniref:Nuclease n=1 Tax=Paracoccus jeotgali TaxID=2065379 RepID=A0A2K9MBH0_9RHOB|nr:VRR-NUC domain-containing protein [Paracoccus jeotgali]AUM72974.1 nuclease [Paracoccus jeotgali]
MTAPSPTRPPRDRPEADIQRQIVALLRAVLPRGAIVHHAANEVGFGGRHARARQAILTGMGVHAGFSDLIIVSGGRMLFLEVKSPRGRLSPAQRAFRDAVQAQGLAWALVRSPEDALDALRAHDFCTRLARCRRSA